MNSAGRLKTGFLKYVKTAPYEEVISTLEIYLRSKVFEDYALPRMSDLTIHNLDQRGLLEPSLVDRLEGKIPERSMKNLKKRLEKAPQ